MGRIIDFVAMRFPQQLLSQRTGGYDAASLATGSCYSSAENMHYTEFTLTTKYVRSREIGRLGQYLRLVGLLFVS